MHHKVNRRIEQSRNFARTMEWAVWAEYISILPASHSSSSEYNRQIRIPSWWQFIINYHTLCSHVGNTISVLVGVAEVDKTEPCRSVTLVCTPTKITTRTADRERESLVCRCEYAEHGVW